MSEARLLVVLPPRQTAQAAAKPASNKTGQPVTTTSFRHKLEKAKQQKSASPVKKPVVATPQKPAAPAKATAEPEEQTSAEGEDSTGDSSTGKETAADQTASDQEAGASDTKPQAQKAAAAAAPPAATTAVATLPRAKTDASKKKTDDGSAGQQGAGKDARDQQPVVKPHSAAQALQEGSNEAHASASAADSASSASSNASASASDSASDVAATSSTAMYGSGKVISEHDLNSNQALVAEASGAQSSAGTAADSSADSASADSATAQPSASVAQPAASIAQPAAEPAPSSHTGADASGAAGIGGLAAAKTGSTLTGKAAAAPTASPQAKFVEENQPKIVSGIQGQLLPNGGTMQITLNPKELGSMQVTVHMQDGVMSAAFETSSDHATKLLSHSLGQLKSGLEASGMTVEKLQVERAPQQDAKSDSESDSKQPPQDQQQQAQEDQQRREAVQRMWRKLSGVEDPLDMVA